MPESEPSTAKTLWSGFLAALSRLNASIEKRLRENIDRQVVSAFIMVAISVIGAVAAYRVGLAEQRSIVLERRLAHGQLQDIGFRQEFLAEVLVKVGLTGLENRLITDAAELRRAFNFLPSGDKSVTSWLEWRAAELVLQRNVVRRFSNYLRDLTTKNSVERELAEKSADELKSQGFLAIAEEGDAARSAVQFPQLQKSIGVAHEVSASLSLCVLLFVAGLVCLTLAELNLGPALVWFLLVSAGAAISAAATVAVFIVDPAAGWILGPLLIVIAAGTVLSVRYGVFRIPHDRAHAPHPEAPEPGRVSFAHLSGHTSHDGWSRSIVLYITAAVFVSAVFGWFYSVSLKHSGHFALEAQAKKTELVNQRARLGAVAMGGVFDMSIKLLTARIRCTSATQLWALAEEGMIGIDADRVESERKQRCGDLAELSRGKEFFLSILDDNNLADSANNPARRMSDTIMDRAGGPQETLALSDGFAEVSVGWSKRAALLLAVLTILAISLYLFGQAYTMGQTLAGRWLIRSGAALLGVSICLGIFAWMLPVVEAPAATLPASCTATANGATKDVETSHDDPAKHEAEKLHGEEDDEAARAVELAARKYADGVRLNNLADTAPSESKERTESDAAAAQSFDCALLVRPGFIPAYKRYVRLLSRMESPQRGVSTYISLNSRTKLGDVHALQRRELKAVADAGMLRPLSQLGNFAFDSTVFALAEGRPDALAEARAALDVVTGTASWWRQQQMEWMQPELWSDETPSSSAVDWFNLGLSQLATGEQKQLDEAEISYDAAL
ncbi:MAG: hypothetical protein K8S25_03025, partial [Alphaproteobacteria bacterium]|nr:hypothetical protein [Alphaproteobacteria bacterium]